MRNIPVTPRKQKPEEPKVTCPVCGDTEKEKDYKPEIGMCSRCRDYLSPKRGGMDYGLFMLRTETWDDQNGRRIASIRPRGFWSGTIEVREQLRHAYNPDTKEIEKSWEVEISWGSGGTDGTLDQVQAAENFIRAMDHAVMLAKTWRTERQEKKEG
jgi:hypothetical protein